jgi:hypothetical protein
MTGTADVIDLAAHARVQLPGAPPAHGDLTADRLRLEVGSGPFSRHFGARLVAERRRGRRPLWVLATRSKGTFTIRDLRDAEAGLLPLDADTVVGLAELYGMRVRELLPPTRRGLEIGDGTMRAGGVTVVFRIGDSRSMVEAYFRLVRTLRAIDDSVTTVPVRHDDLVAMAAHLQRSSTTTSALDRVLSVASAEGRVVVGSLLAGVDALDDGWDDGAGD